MSPTHNTDGTERPNGVLIRHILKWLYQEIYLFKRQNGRDAPRIGRWGNDARVSRGLMATRNAVLLGGYCRHPRRTHTPSAASEQKCRIISQERRGFPPAKLFRDTHAEKINMSCRGHRTRSGCFSGCFVSSGRHHVLQPSPSFPLTAPPVRVLIQADLHIQLFSCFVSEMVPKATSNLQGSLRTMTWKYENCKWQSCFRTLARVCILCVAV